MDDTRRCPYCHEEIQAAAVRCRWCRSRLQVLDPEGWYRDHADRRLAGVAAAVSRAAAVPAGIVRLAFVVLTFVHLLGPLAYAALWLVVPFRRGEPAPFDRVLGAVRAALDRWQSARPSPPPAAGGSGPASPSAPRLPEGSAA